MPDLLPGDLVTMTVPRPPPCGELAMMPDDDVHEVPTLTRRLSDEVIRGLTRPPLVLVAEDDADTRAACAECIAALGCRVLVAANGEQALRLALTTHPDIVVTDLSMPELDGCELARRLRLREGEGQKRTPILAMTAFGASWGRAAREAGCDAILLKPWSTAELEQALVHLFPAIRP